MHNDSKDPIDIDQLKKLKYETSDVSIPYLMKATVFLGLFILVSSVITWGIFKAFVPMPAAEVQDKVVDSSSLSTGQPLLQVNPKLDMLQFRLSEEAKTDQYGWIDKPKGIVHVPVDVMMEKIAASGSLPKAQPGGQAAMTPKPSADKNPSGTLPMEGAVPPRSNQPETGAPTPIAPAGSPASETATPGNTPR